MPSPLARFAPLTLALLLTATQAGAAITATASSHDGHVPAKTLDGKLTASSRWSAYGNGQWIRYDLGQIATLQSMDMAFQRGTRRVYYFDIETSMDGSNWTPLLKGAASSGTSLAFEEIAITPVSARHVRIVGWGNSENLWNSYTEVRLGLAATSTPTTPSPTVPPATEPSDRWQPTAGTTWQWQLSGTVNTGYNAQIYDIDLYDSSTDLITSLQHSGRRVLCYFSAGSYENWRPDATLFQPTDMGRALDGWAGERWLDIRSDNVRSIMKKRLELAKAKGCDGVEPDNIDGYTNATGLPLTYQDQIDYNRFLASTAHSLGLAIALKNDLNQVADLVNDFDMAINEQCHQYNECELLKPFLDANKPVFSAEYASKYASDPVARNAMCAASRALGMHTLILPLYLDDGFRIDCGL